MLPVLTRQAAGSSTVVGTLSTMLRQGLASAGLTTRSHAASSASCSRAASLLATKRPCAAARPLPAPGVARHDARCLTTLAAPQHQQHHASEEGPGHKLRSLAVAAGATLGLLLGSVGPVTPGVPLGARPAHAEAPPTLTATPTLSLPFLREKEQPPPLPPQAPGDVPLNRNTDPMTMQMPETSAELTAEELRAIRIFARNTPSVVNITNIQAMRVGSGYGYGYSVQKVPAGLGSGFVWDDKGHIVTNYHVIQGAADVKVTLLDQSTYSAEVVGGDRDKDVAVLRLLGVPRDKLAALQPVTLGSSGGLLVGQRVFAIGNPLGLEHTLTSGIVSGLNRELSNGGLTIKGLVQTDAAINPGNSGGVLLDSGGRVIGINTAIADPSGKGASSGVGFALPIDAVQGLVDQILQYGRVLRPVLGVTLAPPQVLKQLGQEGVLVLEVPKGSPAEAAGLKPTTRDPFNGSLLLGDIITGLDGRKVRNYSDLVDLLDEKRVGDRVKVDILRSQTDNLFKSGTARRMTVEVTLGERGQVNVTE